MQRSTDRILATHVGSLPRPADLFAVLERRERGEPVDERALEARIDDAVREVVRAQCRHGLDVVNDGEVGKTSFLTYVNSRPSAAASAGRASRVRSCDARRVPHCHAG